MLCPNSLVLSITAAAIIIADGRSSDETALLGNVFSQLGDTLATIAAQKDVFDKLTEKLSNACRPPDSSASKNI